MNRNFVGSDIKVDIPSTILLHEFFRISQKLYSHAEQGIRQLRPTNLQLRASQNGSMPIGLTSFFIIDFLSGVTCCCAFSWRHFCGATIFRHPSNTVLKIIPVSVSVYIISK